MVFQNEYGFENRGSSKSLGGEHDLIILRAMRVWSSAIVTSGPTFQAEGYTDSENLHVLTSRELHLQKATVWGDKTDLATMSQTLRNSYGRILWETGPSVATELLSKSLIDFVVLNTDTEFEKFEHLLNTKLDILQSTEINQWSVHIARPRAASL